MEARLAYGNNYLEISNFCHDKAEAARGNPYNTTFDLVIQSGTFRGTAPCEYDIEAFMKFVNALRKLYDLELYNAQLDDICYGSKVQFAMDRAGHIEVSGKIFGHAMIHSMEFAFNADQTVLKLFIEELNALLYQAER